MLLPRRLLLQSAGVLAAAIVSRSASALDYPVKPIRWIVGYPPGGSADTVSRIMAQWLTERLGQPVIIENKPGAATNISLQAAIGAPADGYTLVYLGTSAVVNPSVFETMPVNVMRDIAPVAGLVDNPFVFVVNKSIAAKSVPEFITYAKANPGRISMASFGAGTSSHLAGELFQAMAGVKLVHVPYRGEAFALADMISGHVEVMFDTLTAALPHIRSGALRALAVAGKTRYDTWLPDVPTVGETVAGYDAMSWGGLGVPRGTSTEIIDRLNREINAGLADPSIRKRLTDIATVPIFYTPAEFAVLMAAESDKWARVVKQSGVKAE